MYGLGAKKPILAIFWTWTLHLGTKLCPYEFIFHAHIEENSNDHFYFNKFDLEKDFWPYSLGLLLGQKYYL